MVEPDEDAAAVSLLVRQMVHYVSTSVAIERVAADMAILERRQASAWTSELAHELTRRQQPAQRGVPAQPGKGGSQGESNGTRGGRATRAAPPGDKRPSASASRRNSVEAAATSAASSRLKGGDTGSRAPVKQRAGAKPGRSRAGTVSQAGGAEASVRPTLSDIIVLGPHGGDPEVTAFTGCVGDAVVAGEDQAVRVLRKRLAQLSAARYETEREERRERLERRTSIRSLDGLASSLGNTPPGAGGAPQVLSGEKMQARMRVERARQALAAAEVSVADPPQPSPSVFLGSFGTSATSSTPSPAAPPLHRVRSHPAARIPMPVTKVTRAAVSDIRGPSSGALGDAVGAGTGGSPQVPPSVLRTALHLPRR